MELVLTNDMGEKLKDVENYLLVNVQRRNAQDPKFFNLNRG